MGRRRIAAAVAVALCLACGRAERRATVADVPVDDGTPQAGGTLVRRLEADVTSLNPLLAATRYDRQVANYLFTPLVYLDRDLQPIRGIAEDWEIVEEGRLYRFQLDKRATFSDGQPVRASDVVFTLRKAVDPASQAVQVAGWFDQVDLAKTRAVGDWTVEVAFRRTLASQLIRFNDLLILPEHVYGKGDFTRDFNEVAVGSGPYRLVTREPSKRVVLERRRDYWGDPPWIQTVVFKVITDHATAWQALRRGDIDETFVVSDTWLRGQADPRVTGKVDLRLFYTLNYNFLAWNLRDPILSDVRVRHAMAAAIPIESIVQDLYRGTARAMTGPFTPEQFSFNPRVPAIRHDLKEATRLMAEAGWRDTDGDGFLDRRGRRMTIELLVMSGSGTTAQFAQMLQGELRKVGVDLEIAVMEGGTAIQRILAGNIQAAYLGWDLDPDPDPFAIFHSSQFPPRGQNFVHYSSREADRLIEEGRRELDPGRRKEIYWKLHEVLAADQPYTWTVQGSSKWGINRRVRGVEVSPGYGLFLWYPGEFAWWIPREQRGNGGVAR